MNTPAKNDASIARLNRNHPVDQPGATGWAGYAVTRARPEASGAEILAITPVQSGWQTELAGHAPNDWDTFARALFGVRDSDTAYILQHGDTTAGTFFAAAFVDDLLTAALLINRGPLIEGRDWLIARLGTPLDPAERFRLLAGRPGGAMAPRGPTVCFCCDVRRNDILDAVQTGCTTVHGIGLATRAGTNCGGCQNEIGLIVGNALASSLSPRS
jgi:assimilatory nitrate reductase catalytic subunit